MREQSCWILLKKVLSEAVLKRLGGLSCSCLRPCGYRVSRTQTVGLHKCALWGYRGRRPDVNTLCFKGREFVGIVSRSSRKAISDLAWRWPGRAWCLLRA